MESILLIVCLIYYCLMERAEKAPLRDGFYEQTYDPIHGRRRRYADEHAELHAAVAA